jgi:hypothetical protein
MRRVVAAAAAVVLAAGCGAERGDEPSSRPVATVAPAPGAPCEGRDLTPLRIVREDDGQRRFFTVAAPGVTDGQIGQAVAVLEACTDGTAWAGGWRLSVFTDAAMAVYKDDPSVAPAMADGRWANAYVAEYDAARKRLIRNPAGAR